MDKAQKLLMLTYENHTTCRIIASQLKAGKSRFLKNIK